MAARSESKLRAELESTRLRLAEAEQALDAIRKGEVDSLVVETPDGPRIFLLEGTNHSYRMLVEAMSEGAATLGQGTIVLYCNACLARMLGAPLERVMGSSIVGWIPERLRATFDALMRNADTGTSGAELALLGPGGEEVPVLVSISGYEDAGRRVSCLLVTDLREQKRNEEIVAEEQLARSVFEQAADAVVVCDPRGRVIRASKAAEALCGRNPLLSNFGEAFPVALEHAPDDEPMDVAAVALRGEIIRRRPGVLTRPDGSRIDVLVSAAGLRGAAGSPVACVVTLVDVTELRRAEEVLRSSERRKDEFLAMLSHELRNPLAPIRNSIHILNHAGSSAEQASRARAVLQRQSEHLNRLVDDLLDVTRIARGKIELRKEPVDVVDVVMRTCEDHRSVTAERGLELSVDVPDGSVFVEGDPTRLAQVVGNLIQNAVKFTPSRGQLSLSVRASAGTVEIRVRDTGVGIEPALLGRVFEPFVQAEGAAARVEGGLGLGLALVKGILELHGGTVSAASAGPGAGSEFIVRLPVIAPPPANARGAAQARGQGARRRVLVVDDNADAAESLAQLIALFGHSTEVAHDGPTAIAKARSYAPDVVLCDIGLPGTMSGYDVARTLRAAGSRRMQLIALTGYARPQDVRRATEAGFDGHLAKPADPAEIERLLA